MSSKHLIIIYISLVALAFFVFTNKITKDSNNINELKNRVTRVEFFQEATRIRENVVGFRQVNTILANDSERAKSCEESKDLLSEWSEDVKKLGTDYSEYIKREQDAKEYYDSITKLNDTIAIDCNKLATKE